MPFVDSYATANDATFRQRLRVVIVKASVFVLSEVQSPHLVLNTKRGIYASKVLMDGGQSQLDPFAYAVVAGGIITTQSPDADVEFTVNSVFNALAGVTGEDLVNL